MKNVKYIVDKIFCIFEEISDDCPEGGCYVSDRTWREVREKITKFLRDI